MASLHVRRPFIGGNWKCNGTRQSVQQLVEGLNAGSISEGKIGIDVVVAPPFLHLDYVLLHISKTIQVSGQNCSLTGNGAFTGEVSGVMLKDLGVNWVILGHSERRHVLKETDQVVGDKVGIAMKSGLNVIACVGETLEQRKNNETQRIVQQQIQAIASNVTDWSRVVIAYEPVWAIGTGLSATPQQAQEVHAQIRSWIQTNCDNKIAETTRIIYGGSVTPQNSDSLIAERDIDGFLVGGASLKAADFIAIVNSPFRKKASL